jgi:hypothetical protein
MQHSTAPDACQQYGYDSPECRQYLNLPKPPPPSKSTSPNNGQIAVGTSIVLYRAVSSGELNDILENQLFRPGPPPAMDAKWFWETLTGAEGWQQQYNLDAIVKVTAPDEVMEFTSSTSENMDNLGPAMSFIDEGLDALNQLLTQIEILGEEIGPIP